MAKDQGNIVEIILISLILLLNEEDGGKKRKREENGVPAFIVNKKGRFSGAQQKQQQHQGDFPALEGFVFKKGGMKEEKQEKDKEEDLPSFLLSTLTSTLFPSSSSPSLFPSPPLSPWLLSSLSAISPPFFFCYISFLLKQLLSLIEGIEGWKKRGLQEEGGKGGWPEEEGVGKRLKPGEYEGLFEHLFLSFLYLLNSAPHLNSATTFYLKKFCESYGNSLSTNATPTNLPAPLGLLIGCLGIGKKQE